MLKPHTLYCIGTSDLGKFYVVATSWDMAASTLTKALDEFGYNAEITSIEIVASEEFYNNKQVCDEEHRLVIDRSCF